MDIHFCNQVMIENCERFFPSVESSPELMHSRRPSEEFSLGSEPAKSQRSDLPTSTPTLCPRVKLTKSFSSSSKLSSNSLPEIQEFSKSPGVHEFSSVTVDRLQDRPRSKSHQQERAGVMGPSLVSLPGPSSRGERWGSATGQ